ncbi:EamA family transporter [Pseudidiomarina taiwanensis]|uniref:EamA family transporter n=2 Tax=Pseudidiomarina taiwanensis TaxID=337250 RepID=A0A432ZF59_9GAMM|nr:EamA family transporter [Pseudidiomarina taiwanensis]
MQANESAPVKAWVFLISLACIWGASFLLMKKGLLAFRPDQVAAIRMASAGFVLLPFILHRLRQVRRHHWPLLFSVGAIGSLIPAFLFAFAQTELPSGVTGVLNTFTPLATLIIGVTLYQQVVRPQQWLGILLGLVGTILLITASATGEFSFNSYGLLIIVATICYGLNLNVIKHKIHDLGALTITGVSLALMAPPSLIYLFVATPVTTQVQDIQFFWSLSAILTLGIVGTAAALILLNTIVKLTDTTFTSSVTYLIPIIALILGVIDGEPFFLQHAIGLCAILMGVWIANKRARKSPTQ